MLLHADSENSDPTGWIQADLSLRWGHRSFFWYCCLVAQIMLVSDLFLFLLKNLLNWSKEPHAKMSLITRKPVFGDPDQVRLKLNYMDELQSWNFGQSKYRYYTI